MSQEKQALRKELLRLREHIAPEERQAWDEALCRAALAHPWYRAAETLLAYYPIGSEPDIRPILEDALEQGKALYLPCCTAETGELCFRRAGALHTLRPGVHGIPAPEDAAPEVLPSRERCLCLVPGLAFDPQGYRLGYGKGYYDRFLSRYSGPSMGLCYMNFIRSPLPRSPHDLPVDLVLTEA